MSLRVGPGHFTSFHAHLCIIDNDANVRFAGKPSQGSRTGNVCRGSSLSKRPFAQGEIFIFLLHVHRMSKERIKKDLNY